MTFDSYMKKFEENFCRIAESNTALFTVRCNPDELYEHYLNSFPEGSNPIYRVRREFDCSECRRFIRQMGNVVAIKNNKLVTIWDFEADDPVYDAINRTMHFFLMDAHIENVFITHFSRIGTAKTLEKIDGKITAYSHFSLPVPSYAIHRTNCTIETVQADYRASRDVLERSLSELTEESLSVVLELIAQNSLYRGAEWKEPLTTFAAIKQTYDMLNTHRERELYTWSMAVKYGGAICRIRNHSIGTLLIDLSAGMDLEQAVRRYEAVVAPANYKRPKALFTERMLNAAKQKLVELGFVDSLSRRHARLDDITVNNILFCDRNVSKRIKGADIFDKVLGKASASPKKFDRVEEISAEKFISDVLPTAHELEVFMENRHVSNLVSLIAPKNPDAKSMFKWDNGFTWAYKGNLADSDIKRNVKNAGGDVDGVLRFSIQWNDIERDRNDLDAHCQTPDCHIYFGNRSDRHGGELDIDIINPQEGIPAVENITWPSLSRMRPGDYDFFIHCYSNNGGKSGVRAEIAFGDELYSYEYNQPIGNGQEIRIATVTLDNQGNFTIKEHLSGTSSSKNVWGLNTMRFVPVTTVMYSPNYWDDQSGIGHKHVFFMLNGCVNDESPNGMYNEFLVNELMEHRRVLEALGNASAVEAVDDQLSGIGFSTTKRNDVIVKVKGASERVLRVKF